MKNLLSKLTVTVVTLCTLQSCLDSTSNESWNGVTPGTELYNKAYLINNMAMDGVDIALKLATLLEQAEYENVTISDGVIDNWNDLDEFTLEYNLFNYGLKYFFFGEDEDVTISKSGNEYTIGYGQSYGNFVCGTSLDKLYRKGVYVIDTKGVKLSESSSSTAWSITVAPGETMEFATSTSSSALAEAVSLDSEIYYSGSGIFNFKSTNYQAQYTNDTVISDWTVSGTYVFEDYEDDLTIDNILDLELSVSILASGTALSGDELEYGTGGIEQGFDPLVYQPFHSLLTIISGTEEVQFLSYYDIEEFPAGYVYLLWSSGDLVIYYNDYGYIY